MLNPGLYEQVVNQLIRTGLDKLDKQSLYAETDRLDEAESAGALAQYMGEVVKAALSGVNRGNALHDRIDLCNRMIHLLAERTGDPRLRDYLIHADAQLLLALLNRRDTAQGIVRGADMAKIRPVTSIAHSSLFTGAPSEPSMVVELKREILTSDRIDMLVSFIKWSGLRLLMDELREFAKSRPLRIITTPYMGATDIKAIDELHGLPNTSIRISYDTGRTRLHAKTYIFHRITGFSTAYVGSSNLSNAALSSGLEWNVKVTAKDLPETFDKIEKTFDSYWHDEQFTAYGDAQRPLLVHALRAENRQGENAAGFTFDITPYGYQKEILEALDAERRIRGHHRNLIVAATGTGKTVISAFDYRRFCETHRSSANRLLFVAHREEILTQSRDCFRTVLRDQNFGELFVGGHEPSSLDHLFVSIQMMNARDFTAATSPKHFDFIIVDEFHHAAADTYQKLLAYYQPSVLLGLTATPERLDARDVTGYFDGRITAEIRLPEAIDRNLLAPFQYFGVSDSVDLRNLTWRRGGYDAGELSHLYTGNRQRADLVLRSLHRYVSDLCAVIGLGFCASIKHAEFMAAFMNRHGIPSRALHAGSPAAERVTARQALARGDLKFIFVVDLYNEGIDIPEINTILFLRPTASLTVFLQQLGRGLRHAAGKDCLTVLDFIGQSHRKYRFEEKLAALLERSRRRSLLAEVRDGFLNVPRACHIQLERQAREYVLENIRHAIGSRQGIIERVRTFAEDTGEPITIANFVRYYHMTARDLYRGASPLSFARLCVQVGVRDKFADPDESVLARALSRISAINSRPWIDFLLNCLEGPSMSGRDAFSPLERQMLLMFHYTVWQKPLNQCGFGSMSETVESTRNNPVLCAEICEILRLNLLQIDFVEEPVELGYESILNLHCSYTRDQILAALGFYTEDRMPAMREGVKRLEEKKLDVFFITLNKSDKDYSPTTMYQDYAISDVLFHWQSQSTTPADSPTGQRYIHHRETGDRVLLFVREWKSDGSGSLPYTFLGTASYVQHSGSRPMNITWRLHRPMPASMLRKANQLVVG